MKALAVIFIVLSLSTIMTTVMGNYCLRSCQVGRSNCETFCRSDRVLEEYRKDSAQNINLEITCINNNFDPFHDTIRSNNIHENEITGCLLCCHVSAVCNFTERQRR